MGIFRKSVNGMPDVGQGDGYERSEFTGRKRIKVSDLVSTNRGGYLHTDRHRGNGTVYVIEHRGKYYVADGHHTAANSNGTVNARVKKVR